MISLCTEPEGKGPITYYSNDIPSALILNDISSYLTILMTSLCTDPEENVGVIILF